MIIAFTGAGISKQSNIPTFMERPEVREKLFRSFANSNPKEYNETIKELKNNMNGAKPNDAHYALKEYDIPIITMNIDGLHRLAGSDPLELHGGLPDDDEMDIAYTLYNKPVLYGDPAPNYQKAYELVDSMKNGDVFLVIGASMHTAIAGDLRMVAKSRGAKIIEIQEDAQKNVRKILEELNSKK
ncbi:Sir2 family NAD-dependent protein deacetylase [Anaerofustis stercorihominis]|uniref:protein acetyllysine N-acetyltransferase n=1 Tax=Anaerofustis stercorihominis TaxID=214853 RepID=A0A3E3E1Y0_9FIRM|nr:Sir2 family NAD-dependent protein deacetylase [Anaerofustis stercorihominis]RGD75473.1 transcriptional regulator [Anaerofustis stercorihominis]